MFSNIGGKIKVLAVVLTIAGICGSVCMGVEIMDSYYGDETYGLLVMIIGSLLSWVLSFTIYGFGEIITHLKRSNEIQEAILRKLNNPSAPTSTGDYTTTAYAPVKDTYAHHTSNTQNPSQGWTCSCGTVNSPDGLYCTYCRNKRN